MGQRIKIRGDTNTAWAAANTVLSAREFGYDTVNKLLKIGDGATAWNSLAPIDVGKKSVLTVNNMLINSTSQQTHSLGAIPNYVYVEARCKVANNGYAIGDRIYNFASLTHVVWADATNISIRFNTTLPSFTPKTGGAAVAMTAANWDIVITAKM